MWPAGPGEEVQGDDTQRALLHSPLSVLLTPCLVSSPIRLTKLFPASWPPRPGNGRLWQDAGAGKGSGRPHGLFHLCLASVWFLWWQCPSVAPTLDRYPILLFISFQCLLLLPTTIANPGDHPFPFGSFFSVYMPMLRPILSIHSITIRNKPLLSRRDTNQSNSLLVHPLS